MSVTPPPFVGAFTYDKKLRYCLIVGLHIRIHLRFLYLQFVYFLNILFKYNLTRCLLIQVKNILLIIVIILRIFLRPVKLLKIFECPIKV